MIDSQKTRKALLESATRNDKKLMKSLVNRAVEIRKLHDDPLEFAGLNKSWKTDAPANDTSEDSFGELYNLGKSSTCFVDWDDASE